MLKPKNRGLTLVVGLAIVTACGDEGSPTSPSSPSPGDTSPQSTLTMSFAGVDPLANGFHYEGWAIVGGEPVSTGKFNLTSDGVIVGLDGAPIAGSEFAVSDDISNASAIVITIEPDGDVDAQPAATKYLGGNVSGSAAQLEVSHGAALGSTFAGAAGRFILATPTDGAGNNELSGLWFLDPRGGPSRSLELPGLPAGWTYEGWAVHRGIPITTGRFADPGAADESAPFSGPQPGPPFPGEDFLTNAPAGLRFPTNLAGATAVITIEPEPDDSPAPFTLKPLVGPIPADVTSGRVYAMGLNAAAFPTGTATIR